MKIAYAVARILLGVIFTVFGLNGFLHFIPMSPVPPLAGQLLGALVQSQMMSVIFALQLVSGVLLLANRFVPLALAVLAAIITNILLFHLFMAPAGIALALLVVVLWAVSAYHVRSAFAGLLQPVAETSASAVTRRGSAPEAAAVKA